MILFVLNRRQAIILFPGHALHEKGLHGRKGVGPLPSSLETMSVVNRSLCFPMGLYGISLVRAAEDRLGDVSSMPRKVRGTLVSLANCCRRPLLPDPAPPLRHAPRPDPPVVCTGFGIGRYIFEWCGPQILNCFAPQRKQFRACNW